MKELDRGPGRPCVVVGHRGAMGHAPENTMASFRRAVSLGADAVELDVRLSADGEAVVIHDSTVDRTTDGKGAVAEMEVVELKRLNAGVRWGGEYDGEGIPTLGQFLAWAAGRTEAVIEIKGEPEPPLDLVRAVVALVTESRMVESVMVISFHHPSVRRVREMLPEVATGILYTGHLCDTAAAARAAAADSVRPGWHHVTRGLVEEVHAAGLIVAPWTVNDQAAMEALLAMGVDSIATNYPDRLRLLVGARARPSRHSGTGDAGGISPS